MITVIFDVTVLSFVNKAQNTMGVSRVQQIRKHEREKKQVGIQLILYWRILGFMLNEQLEKCFFQSQSYIIKRFGSY